MTAPGTKMCTRCLQHKPPGQFYRDRHRPDGLRCECRQCTGDIKRELRSHPERAVSHGYGAYCNWGCRCDVCRAANAEHQRGYRAAGGAA